MNEENRITLILIDTCAFRDANSDFPGIVKSLLPSFFTDAEAEVDCEILISFDFDDPESTAQVMEFHLLNQGNICINCEGASIREIDEEELSVRTLREDKGCPRRNTK